MRLEQLFQQLDHFMNSSTVHDNRAAISILLEIILIFSRNDLKSELLKELDRHVKKFNQIAKNKNVDTKKLNEILDQLNTISKKLYSINGKIGINVMESDLFQSISQRSSIPGGSCSFDLPAFHYWLNQNHTAREQDLIRWTKPFMDIQKAIKLTLNFIRQSNTPSEELAEAGFYQLSLEKSQPFQLLRVGIEQSTPCFAEISGGKHRFTIRFMNPSVDNKRPTQIANNVSFLLTRCVF